MMGMKLLLTLLLCLSVLSSIALAQGVPASPASGKQKSAGFDPKRDAAKDIADAIAKAKKVQKRVLIDVGGEWCPWCHKLEEFFEANKDVTEFRDKNFVTVKVNWSPENKNEAALAKYPKIPSFPHLFVLDSSGKLLKAQDTGELESGDHHDRDKVLNFLKKWAK